MICIQQGRPPHCRVRAVHELGDLHRRRIKCVIIIIYRYTVFLYRLLRTSLFYAYVLLQLYLSLIACILVIAETRIRLLTIGHDGGALIWEGALTGNIVQMNTKTPTCYLANIGTTVYRCHVYVILQEAHSTCIQTY